MFFIVGSQTLYFWTQEELIASQNASGTFYAYNQICVQILKQWASSQPIFHQYLIQQAYPVRSTTLSGECERSGAYKVYLQSAFSLPLQQLIILIMLQDICTRLPLPSPLISSKLSQSKTSSSSSSMSESGLNPQDCKEKSQLCRRYMQFGCCPYQKKCKFAHGSHELLRNNQQNMKYKTKECEHFRDSLTCMYGNRCNFIHTRRPPDRSTHDPLLALIRATAQPTSRLLALLKHH